MDVIQNQDKNNNNMLKLIDIQKNEILYPKYFFIFIIFAVIYIIFIGLSYFISFFRKQIINFKNKIYYHMD